MKKLIATLICLFVFTYFGLSQTEWGGEIQHAFGKGANDNMIGGRYEGFSGGSSWSFGLTYNFSCLSHLDTQSRFKHLRIA